MWMCLYVLNSKSNLKYKRDYVIANRRLFGQNKDYIIHENNLLFNYKLLFHIVLIFYHH